MPSRIESLDIEGPAGRLEALLTNPERAPRAASVVAHPHPLHGGTMHSRVVFRAGKALERQAVATLRFNFRGVGRSAGTHDAGRGEKEDLRAAVGALSDLYPGLPVVVGGYSFGAVMALGLPDSRIAHRFALGYPLTFAPLPPTLAELRPPVLFVQGENDAYGTGETLQARLDALPVRHEIVLIPGADHAFDGRLDLLEGALETWVGEALR